MTDNSYQLEDINPHTGLPYSERPNKTALKRDMKILHDLGRELIELPDTKFETIPLSERMYDAVFSGKKMKKSALQRQLRYISSIMPEEDVEAIQFQLRILAQPIEKANDQFHQIENWRDELIAGDADLINTLVDEIQADRQKLRQLVRNATKDAQQEKSPKASRLLFKYLKELQESL
ncbi:MAG: ribosome-associated protein [Cocleimonas sp.]|jgi:ribosome-associated protein